MVTKYIKGVLLALFVFSLFLMGLNGIRGMPITIFDRILLIGSVAMITCYYFMRHILFIRRIIAAPLVLLFLGCFFSFMLDLRSALLMAKSQSKERLYYRNDTHWNAFGAFYGFNAIQNALGEEVINLGEVSIKNSGRRESDISSNFLNLKELKEDEFVFEYFKSHSGMRSPNDDYKIHNANVGNGSDIEYNNPSGNGKSILLFRDSFSISLLPYLTSVYSRVRAVWSYEIDYKIIEEFKPDYVLFENVERHSDVLFR